MRVVGLGQPVAGDDGVGLAVARAVKARRPAAQVVELTDAAGLIELLEHAHPARVEPGVVNGDVAVFRHLL